ncbi:hypothetical protein FHT44_005124 [Mycolicibacterium sp. BK634]|uniref:hypothetical protein n=1 Tax=Mycolicibacterium sp. BK634 TaxID=2587099 RepID=UPI00161F295A|nr:hypothetical protein [Mycolicibacterium sp. BK634]MBB3752612.1 hypothetical protein [Mycolicibacterium sp. BK634]
MVHTRVPALPVELTDDIAAGLGDIVRAVNENPDVPDAPVEADPPKRGRGRTASDIAPAPEVDPAPEGDGS